MEPHRAEILSLARKYGARNVRIFGSVARHEATSKSDVDVLYDRTRRTRRIDLALALERTLGRKVDVVAEDDLFWLMKPQVVAEAVPL